MKLINKNQALIVQLNCEVAKNNDINAALDAVVAEIDQGIKASWVIFDFLEVKNMNNNAVPALARAVGELSQRDLKCGAIAGRDTAQLIRSQALDSLITLFKSLDDYVQKTTVVKKNETTVFLNTMLESVQHTMKISLECDVKAGSPKVIKGADGLPSFQVGALAGIVSAAFDGNMIIGFEKVSFLRAMSLFLQMEVKELTSDIKDGAAELLNVIIGQTKIKLNEKGFEIKQVIPSVITGEKVDVGPMARASAIVIPYTASFGNFHIVLTTQSKVN